MRVILQPRRNAWRIEKSNRAAVLLDGCQYFAAARAAMLKAQSTIFILGWDLDSRMRLVGDSSTADDGYPEGLIDFLTALVNERPKLVVHLLMWDYSMIYALERELFPVLSLRWRTPSRIRLCLDDDLPAGASHHQKILVVDDAVAFSGGLDLTIRRWDTCDHHLDNPLRTDPSGYGYAPFHDVQAVVDGSAARALAELARARWARAALERPRPVKPHGDRWPEGLTPHFTGIDVGVARTCPESDDEQAVREVEALFLDSVTHAERMIYIENQYITFLRFAEKLAQRMLERPELEAVIVVPKTDHSWLEALTMRRGRLRFMRILHDAGVSKRARVFYPEVTDGGRSIDTMVHSKVMIVDDALVRVGSANLNNRSIGLDTECDLAFEAATEEQRAEVVRLRNKMLGHHCGATAEEVATSLAQTRSLIATAEHLTNHGHRLHPIGDDAFEQEPSLTFDSFADPERPIEAPALVREVVGGRPHGRRLIRVFKVLAAALFLILLMLAWQFTPLAAFTDPETVQDGLDSIAGMRGAWAIVLGIFVVAGLLAFPVTLLIAATAATFGPLLGFTYAAAGALLSAAVTYAVGARIGRRMLQDVLGPRLNRIRRGIAKRGVLAIATVRLVPLAPFTFVNLVAGASRIPLQDYMLGTVIGMAPGLVLMSLLGHQLLNIVVSPTPLNVAVFLAGVTAWVALSLGIQALVLRARRRRA